MTYVLYVASCRLQNNVPLSGVSSMRRYMHRHQSAGFGWGKYRLLWVSVTALAAALLCAMSPGISAAASSQSRELAAEAGPDYTANRLVGTVNGGVFSGAVFENTSGEQKFYRKGETFLDGSRIITVSSTSILVKNAGGSVVEYMVSRGTTGAKGTASAALPATAPQTMNSAIVYDGTNTPAPKRKRIKAGSISHEDDP